MNRYVVDGIKADLAAGLRVGVVAHTMVGAHAVFASVAEAMNDDAEKITRTNGHERITTKAGGEFRVFSRRSKGMRGVSLDVLVIADHVAYTHQQYRDLMDEALPTMAAGPRFELIPA